MLTDKQTKKFKKDYDRMKKRGKDVEKLKTIIGMLIDETPLPSTYKDHPLVGNLQGYRNCHIEFDWVLIYAIQGNDLVLFRTGTHSDILE